MRKFIRIVGVLLILVLAGVGVTTFLGYRATQQVPEFYQEVLTVEPAVQEEKGDELEKQVLELHNEVADAGRWEAVFTDEQINGWLAYDLPRKVSGVLPPGVSDPRVSIDPEQARIACRYESTRFKSVFSLALEIQLTDEPNVLAVCVRQARAGMLPIPINRFLKQISRQAQDADVIVRWTQADGDPVALVTIPTRHEQYPKREIHLEAVELQDGAIRLVGRTNEGVAGQQASAAKPQVQR